MSGVWVIFEGPDGAGKTTAALRTVKFMAGRAPTVFQRLDSKSEFGDYYGPPRLWTGAGLNVVQDRSTVSDLVYAPVLFGGPSRLGEKQVRDQLRRIAAHAIVIYMTAEEDDLIERLAERGDDLIDGSMVHAILKGYWREIGWWRDAGAVVHEIDTTGGAFPSPLDLELAVAVGHEMLQKQS